VGVAGTGDGSMGSTPLCTKRPVRDCRAHERMREREAAVRNRDEPSLLGRPQVLEAQVGQLERPRDGCAILSLPECQDEERPARLRPERADAGKDGMLRGSTGDERVAKWDAPNALPRRETERDLAQRERVAVRDVDDLRDNGRRELVAETSLEEGQ